MATPKQSPVELPDLLTVGEVAVALHCRHAKVRSLAHRRVLPFYRVGKAVMFERGAVAAYLATCFRPAISGGSESRASLHELRVSTPSERLS